MKSTLQKNRRHRSFARLMAVLVVCSAAVNTSALAQAQATATAHDGHAATQPATTAAAASETAAPAVLSEGEITRWDPRTLRVTLRHGELKNLEMPPMTMVFRVENANVVGDLKAGDKVRFRAERVSGAFHVTRMEKAN